MQCQSCGEVEANVHLTHVVDGAAREIHLCEECAAKNGINVDAPMSVTDLLAGFEALEGVDAGAKAKKCPLCGMKIKDFQKTSRLGCPACYDTFHAELKRVLAGWQKGDRHAGKRPAWSGTPAEDAAVATLRKELETAIADEKYEEAARLRDRILLAKAKAEREIPGEKVGDN